MITKLQLEDWKSFHRAEVLIDQLTFIIGRNASGKSNIVDALWFLSRLGQGGRISDAVKDIRGGVDQIIRKGCEFATLRLSFKKDKSDYKYMVRLGLSGNELYVKEEKLTKTANRVTRDLYVAEYSPDGSHADVIDARFTKDTPGQRRKITLRRDMTVLSQVSGLNVIKDTKEAAETAMNIMRGIFILDPSPSAMRGFTSLADKLEPDGSNVAGVIAAMSDVDREKLLSDLTQYVRNLPEKDVLDVEVDTVGRFRDAAMLYCKEGWTGEEPTETDARSMSDGTLRFIAIVVAMLTMQPDSLLVIEEIDNGLHPSRTGELVKALSEISNNCDFDVVCTTHNPVLIDSLSGEIINSVCCVTRNGEGGSSVATRLQDMPQFLRLLASYTPGEMMALGKLATNH